MKVYHGTTLESAMNIINNGVCLSYSQKMLDFGKGFYTTNSKEHAIKTAKNKTFRYNTKTNSNLAAAVITFEYENNIDLNIRIFDGHNEEWMKFILANRMDEQSINRYKICDHNLDCKYDIVQGEIADGIISQKAAQIRTGKIDYFSVDIKDLLTKEENAYGFQISFHTQKSLDCIKYIKCDIIL